MRISPFLERVVARKSDAFPAGNRHCRIVWDGKEDDKSAVIVADYSSNGTFVRTDAFSASATHATHFRVVCRSTVSGSAGIRPRSSKREMKLLLGPLHPSLEVSRITVRLDTSRAWLYVDPRLAQASSIGTPPLAPPKVAYMHFMTSATNSAKALLPP